MLEDGVSDDTFSIPVPERKKKKKSSAVAKKKAIKDSTSNCGPLKIAHFRPSC